MGWDKLSNEKPRRNSKSSEAWLHQNVEERLINKPKWKTRTIEREYFVETLPEETESVL